MPVDWISNGAARPAPKPTLSLRNGVGDAYEFVLLSRRRRRWQAAFVAVGVHVVPTVRARRLYLAISARVEFNPSARRREGGKEHKE